MFTPPPPPPPPPPLSFPVIICRSDWLVMITSIRQFYFLFIVFVSPNTFCTLHTLRKISQVGLQKCFISFLFLYHFCAQYFFWSFLFLCVYSMLFLKKKTRFSAYRFLVSVFMGSDNLKFTQTLNNLYLGGIISTTVCTFICLLARLCSYYRLEFHEKKSENGSWPTWIPLNFESDLDHFLETKIIQNICTYLYLLILMFLGGSRHSPSALQSCVV